MRIGDIAVVLATFGGQIIGDLFCHTPTKYAIALCVNYFDRIWDKILLKRANWPIGVDDLQAKAAR